MGVLSIVIYEYLSTHTSVCFIYSLEVGGENRLLNPHIYIPTPSSITVVVVSDAISQIKKDGKDYVRREKYSFTRLFS
jgi:hypothetical protein